MKEWVMVVVALALVAVSLLRSGWTRGIRHPVTSLAAGIVCGNLRGALHVSWASMPGMALLTAELAALAFTFYLLRHVNSRDGNAA